MPGIAIKQKNIYIDYLKAIAAVFVVVGHCISYLENYNVDITTMGNYIGVFVSSVHVPLFFLIAGYLCHKQPYKVYVKKKAHRIILPYIVFSVLKLLFTVLISSKHAHGSTIGAILYDTIVLGGAYWFIYCMFFVYLLAPVWWRRNSEGDKSYNTKLLIVLGILTLFNILSVDLKIINFPDELTFGGYIAKTPFFQIERVLYYFPYFVVGMLLRNNQEKILWFINRNKHFLLITAILVITVLCRLVVHDILLKGFIVKMGIAFSAILLLYHFVKIIPSGCYWLTKIGKYSLQVMFFDSFYRVLLFNIVSRICCPNVTISLLIAASTVLLACVSSEIASRVPVVRYLFGLK